MRIRAEEPSDYPAIYAVNEDAFRQPDEAKLVDALRANGDLEISLVAEQAGRIAGHVSLSRLRSPPQALALGPLAVRTTHQHQGIGTQLVDKSLDLARQRGWLAVFLLGYPSYYQRFGFSTEAAAGFSCRYAGPNFMAVFLTESPNRSGNVIYAAPFDDLE